jgi:hypothetical protein
MGLSGGLDGLEKLKNVSFPGIEPRRYFIYVQLTISCDATGIVKVWLK